MLANRGFDDILFDIVSGMTFDPEHDRAYLDEAMLQYRNHPLGYRIIEVCKRLRSVTAPDKAQEEVLESLAQQRGLVMDDIDMAWVYIKEGKLETAFSLVEPLALRYDDLSSGDGYKDDEERIYLDFNSMAEEFIYRLVHREDQRQIKLNPEPFAEVYLAYGACLVESGRIEDAVPELAKAARWNPAEPKVWFTRADVHASLGEEELFDQYTEEAYPYIWMVDDLVHYHRNKAKHHLASGDRELAAAHLMMALDLEQSEEAREELLQLKARCGDHGDMDGDQAVAVLERAGANILPGPDAVTAIREIVNIAVENGEGDAALPLAINLYSITGDEEMKAVIEHLMSGRSE